MIRYVCFVCLAIVFSHCREQKKENMQWLSEKLEGNLHNISNLEFSSSNFSQYSSLKTAIGKKKIVLLGEQTHGDGTTFEAKCQLIKFLHEEMDFDLLVFESGFYQSSKVMDQLDQGKSVSEVFPKGLNQRWSDVKEVQPLLSYIKEGIGKENFLKIAGMDVLLDGQYSKESLVYDFENFVQQNYPNIRDKNFRAFSKTIQGLQKDPAYLLAREQKAFFDTLTKYIALFEKEDSKQIQSTSAFWAQVWRNFSVNLKNSWSRTDGTYSRPEYFSRRDSMMAENISWLMKESKKVIVWSSVTHNMRDFDPELLEQMGWSSNTKFMGEYLEELRGADEMFHLTFTGYKGTYADIYNNYSKVKFTQPSDKSLEATMQQYDEPFCYFIPDASWLNKRFKASFIFNTEYESDWARSIDAIFFTQKMEASRLSQTFKFENR